MSDKPDFKYNVIPAEALGTVRKYIDLLDGYEAQMQALADEYRAKAEEIRALNKEARKALWFELAAAAGVDAAASWDVPGWSLDVNYIDHGFTALVHQPQPQNPFAAMFGAPEEEEEEVAEEGAPKGETIN